jgi:hypothetical protein
MSTQLSRRRSSSGTLFVSGAWAVHANGLLVVDHNLLLETRLQFLQWTRFPTIQPWT